MDFAMLAAASRLSGASVFFIMVSFEWNRPAASYDGYQRVGKYMRRLQIHADACGCRDARFRVSIYMTISAMRARNPQATGTIGEQHRFIDIVP
jgi:hypothetical protein